MTEAEVFILSDHTLNDVVQQIGDDQWAMKLPEWFEIGRTQERDTITLRNIVSYHVFDDAWVPAVLAGQAKDDFSGVPADMNADLLGDNPKGVFAG